MFSDLKAGTDLAGLTSKRIGDLGESIATACLGTNGFTDIMSIKNASNNGIDIVARLTSGRLYFFEVKTTAVGRAGSLSARQADMANFVNDILSQASTKSGRYKSISDAEQAAAAKIYQEFNQNRNNISGQVIRVDLQSDTLNVSPW